MSSYRSGQDDPNVAWTLALCAVMASAVLVRWLAHVNVLALAGLAVGLVVVVIVARKAFSRKYLARNRVRQMRLRAGLRLRPGPGMASVFELHVRWRRRGGPGGRGCRGRTGWCGRGRRRCWWRGRSTGMRAGFRWRST